MVASGNVGAAFGMVLGAGAASSLGASIVFCVSLAKPSLLASSLGFAAGVMLYVCMTEIFMIKSNNAFQGAAFSEPAAYRLATACFFGGILLTAILDACVHRMMHWAAGRQQQRAHMKAARKNSARSRSTVELIHAAGSACPGKGATAQHQHCACLAARQQQVQQQQQEQLEDSASEHDLEAGSTGSSDGGDATEPCSGLPGQCCAFRPDCLGTVARCHNTGAGDARKDIQPGTAQAEVVAVLQSDPHTADLLRMGVFTALAIALHNLPEGLATFVGALQDTKVGASIAAAIAIHNIPEGICVAMPIYYATGSRWKGFFWGSLTGLAEPLGGLLGYLVLSRNSALSFGIVFGIVAGMMTYVSVKELLPSAFKFDPKDRAVSTSVLVGMGVMATSLVLFSL